MKYISLHTHTTYSTGDGFGLPSEHVKAVVDCGMKGLGVSEHGNVSSWVDLEQEAEKAGIEPFFGIEAYVGIPGERRKTHMILIAMNSIGVQNINRIVTQSWKQFHQFPTVYFEDLERWNEGVIILSGCADSAISCILLGGKYFGEKRLESSKSDIQRATRVIRRFQKIFGDRYYLEVQRFPGLDRTCALNPILAELSRDTGAQLVATSDVHYPEPTQNAVQRILHAAHRGGTVETADASWEYDILLTYPRSDREIFKDLVDTGLSQADAKQAILNTAEIAQRCWGTRLPKAQPPRFVINNQPLKKPKDFLRHRITEGWKYRLKHNTHMQTHISEYKERLKHEYETICAREGFADYFLIVADLVTWAKNRGIAVGPGRGSAAGSLVCYLLRITEIDSMQFPMLFERFLDPTRTDPPDIDIDFQDDRRDEVFDYAASKYGSDRVGNILTFTRYLGRSALDDIARVYHVPVWMVEQFKGKLIERAEGHPRFSNTIEDTINTFPDVADLVKQRPELRYAAMLEGNLRSFSVHAAGMVITTRPINEICATYEREVGGRVAQAIPFDKRDAVYSGLLKIDALSLITMGEIAGICELAGIKLEELYRIPLDDNETLQAFRDGDVMGIFQFEGLATRRILKQVQPTTFMHLADVNALSRPGADDKAYVENKNSGEQPEYVHPIMAQHLSWTYGVVVYEEQILMILRDLGGFEPKELNRMRKIIHDKLGSTVFNEYLERFIKGAATQGLSETSARSIWDGLVSASGYAFNIAHSVSYAHIGYWLQWLKIHYTSEFYTKKLTKCSDDVRRGKFIQEAGRHGISVEPPRLLESGHDWTLNKEHRRIMAGFGAIKGIGPKTIDNILQWRESLTDTRGLDWDDLVQVPGIGPGRIRTIRDFVESDDPFGVQAVARTLEKARGSLPSGVPTPTHISIDIPPTRKLVSYIGIARRKKYYDAVERLQSKTAEDISYEEALKRLRDNHLIKYCSIEVEDEYGEIVKLWIHRWKYPKFKNLVESIKKDRDVVLVQGYSSDYGGLSIQVEELWRM